MKEYKNVPLGDVRAALKDFPKEKYIDVTCRVRIDSGVNSRSVVLRIMHAEFSNRMALRYVMFLEVGIPGDYYLIRSKSLCLTNNPFHYLLFGALSSSLDIFFLLRLFPSCS